MFEPERQMFLGEKEKCRRGTGLYEAVQKNGMLELWLSHLFEGL